MGFGMPEWNGSALLPLLLYRANMNRIVDCCRREDSSPMKGELSGDEVSFLPIFEVFLRVLLVEGSLKEYHYN